MANAFAKTAGIVRDHEVEGYNVRIFIDGEGIKFQRKGDRNRDKPQIVVPWGTVMELGAERQGVSAYVHLGFEE